MILLKTMVVSFFDQNMSKKILKKAKKAHFFGIFRQK